VVELEMPAAIGHYFTREQSLDDVQGLGQPLVTAGWATSWSSRWSAWSSSSPSPTSCSGCRGRCA